MNVVRAARFEIVDQSGKPLAFWGPDDLKQMVLGFKDKGNNVVASLGMSSTGVPFFDMSGSDGRSRVRIELSSSQKPTLAMSDAAWEGRVLLGFVQNDVPDRRDDDWFLRFRAPGGGELGGIGMARTGAEGRLSGKAYVRGAGKEWSAP
jgi:hypothetical protein